MLGPLFVSAKVRSRQSSEQEFVLMQESGSDPIAPELLAADRAVAAAARHAISLTKALKVCSRYEAPCTDREL